MTLVATCVQSANATVGEIPAWDPRRKALWWGDVRQGRVFLYSPERGQIGQWWLPSQIFALSLTTRGRLLVALQDGLYFLEPETGEFVRHGLLVHGPDTTRFNDGKVDASGRLWVGTRDLDRAGPTGVLYVVHPDGSFEPKLHGIRGSNGLGWTADGRTMFHTDSTRKVIWSFEFDAETSTIAGQKVFAQVEDEGVVPDGLSVDRDGCVWSVLFGGAAVVRFDPAGREIERVRVPASHPTSCAFGGDDLKTLFITSESFRLPVGTLKSAPDAGGLFAVQTQSVGVAVERFAEM